MGFGVFDNVAERLNLCGIPEEPARVDELLVPFCKFFVVHGLLVIKAAITAKIGGEICKYRTSKSMKKYKAIVLNNIQKKAKYAPRM